MIGQATVLIALRILVCSFISFSPVEGWVQMSCPTCNDGINKAKFSYNKGNGNISVAYGDFLLDNKPMRIISGSMHYFRLPPEYWRDRLRKLRTAGLNCVSTYIEWSFHEPEERQYNFEGDRDIVRFLEIAKDEGLYVLLRPGPYICAERDLGGLPYWLLGKYPHIKLRTTDKAFIYEVRVWFIKLFRYLDPFLNGNGGPIILIQVENEYGNFGEDTLYMRVIRDMLLDHVGHKAVLYTADPPPKVLHGKVYGVVPTINFGPNKNVDNVFKGVQKHLDGGGPLMNSEYYTGWITHWNDTTSAKRSSHDIIRTLREMLIYGVHVNFYMFYGGTNFEFTAGANYDEKLDLYQPDITSYDYDAPLTEAGDPTFKYFAIRDVIKEYYPELVNNALPKISVKGSYGEVKVRPRYNLLSVEGRLKLGKKYKIFMGANLPTFEELRQRAGLMLYETNLNDTDGVLQIEKPHDRVYVYVDKKLQGILSRMTGITKTELNARPGSSLSLLVENQGRINYQYFNDFKGILSNVKHNDKILNGAWTVIGFPLRMSTVALSSALDKVDISQGPILYSGQFSLEGGRTVFDTYLNVTSWGKGYVWINGHNLGRYWPNVGPQETLYVPGVWMKRAPAMNLLQILELEHVPKNLTVTFIDHPILR